MHTICRIDLAARDGLAPRIDEFIGKLRQQFTIYLVYAFGSYGKGDLSEASDIDIFIVGDFPMPFFERMVKVSELTDLPIEPWVYIREEFEEMKTSGNTFISTILENGVRLF